MGAVHGFFSSLLTLPVDPHQSLQQFAARAASPRRAGLNHRRYAIEEIFAPALLDS